MTDRAASPGALRGFAAWAGDAGTRLYLRPLGLDGRSSHPLAGGPLRFERAELIARRDGAAERAEAGLGEIVAWARDLGVADSLAAWLAALGAARSPLAGMALDEPRVMGVINVTPDSFSDGGDFHRIDSAIRQGEALRAAGADILDVGGESTRPGAAPVTAEEEKRRVLPVVRALAEAGAVVSIDTRRAAVMAAALEAGATVINDVTALTGDRDSLSVVRGCTAPVVLMHMLGEPRTMQDNPRYRDAPLDVFDRLAARIAVCEAAGVDRARLVVDPGIGFGKRLNHNLQILRALALYHGLGCPVLVGVSRKSFIGTLSGEQDPKRRLPGSLAAGLAALDRGVQILRVHDVAETRQAIAVWQALRQA